MSTQRTNTVICTQVARANIKAHARWKNKMTFHHGPVGVENFTQAAFYLGFLNIDNDIVRAVHEWWANVVRYFWVCAVGGNSNFPPRMCTVMIFLNILTPTDCESFFDSIENFWCNINHTVCSSIW